MKIDLDLISAAIDAVLERSGVAPFGAIPLRALTEQWESVHLRTSDLGAGIEELCRQGRIGFERRRDGLWVRRRRDIQAAAGAYEGVIGKLRRFALGQAVQQVARRRPDDYAGSDRRAARAGAAAQPGGQEPA
jgi:hypothetical protein